MLGSPHLALTVASLPALARVGGNGGVFRCPEFVAAVAARVEERVGVMEKWEREMVVEGVKALKAYPSRS